MHIIYLHTSRRGPWYGPLSCLHMFPCIIQDKILLHCIDVVVGASLFHILNFLISSVVLLPTLLLTSLPWAAIPAQAEENHQPTDEYPGQWKDEPEQNIPETRVPIFNCHVGAITLLFVVAHKSFLVIKQFVSDEGSVLFCSIPVFVPRNCFVYAAYVKIVALKRKGIISISSGNSQNVF